MNPDKCGLLSSKTTHKGSQFPEKSSSRHLTEYSNDSRFIMDLSSLPHEILPNIFKFLHVEDRKSVRLTCREWCNACNRPEIIISEKFVFRRGHDGRFIESMGEQMEECNHFRTDWEFHTLRLSDLPVSVWEHCGPHMKSLLLMDCDVDDYTMKNIIVYCSNMKTFHSRNSLVEDDGMFSDRTSEESFRSDVEPSEEDSSRECSSVLKASPSLSISGKNSNLPIEDLTASQEDLRESLDSEDTSFGSEDEDEDNIYFDYMNSEDGMQFWSADMLQELIDQKIERRNLVSFKLFTRYPLPNELFEAFFRIYPRIQTFGYGYDSMSELAGNQYPYILPNGKWIYPPLIQNFKASFSTTPASWTESSPKFKSFSTLLDLDNYSDVNDIYKFFSGQTELEKLELMVCSSDHLIAKPFLLRLLRSLPELKELHFHSFCDPMYCEIEFDFSSAEFGEFLTLTSQLESLTFLVNCGVQLKTSFNSLLLPSTEYSRLKKLRLGRDMDERINFEILSRCRSSLEYISLHPTNHKIMERLFNSQIEVRSLFLDKIPEFENQESSSPKASSSPKQKRKSYASKLKKKGNPSKRGRGKTLSSLVKAVNSIRLSPEFSFQSFRNLEHLSIENVSFSALFNHLNTFDFPNLKYFYIQFHSFDDISRRTNKKNYRIPIFRKMLDVLSTKSPKVEILRLSENFLEGAELLKYCKRWKYLRILGMNNLIFDTNSGELIKLFLGEVIEFNREVKDVVNLFVECRSLRWIVNFSICHAYFFDQFSKTLKRYRHFINHDHKHNVAECYS